MSTELLVDITCIVGFLACALLICFAMDRFFDTVYKNAGRKKKPVSRSRLIRRIIRQRKDHYGSYHTERKDHTDLSVILSKQRKGHTDSAEADDSGKPSGGGIYRQIGI